MIFGRMCRGRDTWDGDGLRLCAVAGTDTAVGAVVGCDVDDGKSGMALKVELEADELPAKTGADESAELACSEDCSMPQVQRQLEDGNALSSSSIKSRGAQSLREGSS